MLALEQDYVLSVEVCASKVYAVLMAFQRHSGCADELGHVSLCIQFIART
jgi:hypothetical protein